MITTSSPSDSTRVSAPASDTPANDGTLLTLLRTRAEWRVAVALALLAAGIYQVFVSGILNSFIADRSIGVTFPLIFGFVTAILVLCCSAAAATYFPKGAWRWGLTIGLAPSIVVSLRIAFDIAFVNPKLHNLFPLEIVMVILLTVPAAFVGASIGAAIGRSMNRLPD